MSDETTTSDDSAAMSVKQPRGRPFLPGQSGNPSGRPAADREFKAWARSLFDEGSNARAAIESALAKGSGEDFRFALKLLVEQGFGRATQPISGDPDGREPLEIIITRGSSAEQPTIATSIA